MPVHPVTRMKFPPLIGLLALGLASAAGAVDRKPNIIVIFTDDQGWADLGCQGSLADVRTPHIDKLAADGVRCTQGYVTAPQCIPSRAGLLAGRHQGRFGLDQNGTIPLPLGEILFPRRLQKAGYVTGMVGKWHLDPNHQSSEWIRENLPHARAGKDGRIAIPPSVTRFYQPDRRGFSDCFSGQHNHYWATYDLQGKTLEPARFQHTEGYRLDVQTDAALGFIDRHAGKPFFLYLAYFAPHVPLEATPKYLNRFHGQMPERRRVALAMLSAMDDGVGRLRQRLEQHGLTRDTLIFFISDNGAPLKIEMKDLPLSFKGGAWDGSRNDPWVGEKGMLTEGGIRVPYLVTWPGTLPAGKVYDLPVTTLDVGATAVAVAGLEPPASMEGANLVPHFTGEIYTRPHDLLCWRFWNQAAVRRGKWKYLMAGDREYLFNLELPEHETLNFIERHPGLANELRTELRKWAAEMEKPGLPGGPLEGAEKEWYDHYLPRRR